MDCLGEFKTLGYDVTNKIFAACIISQVTTVKHALMESLMTDESLVSDPYCLLEKLCTFAVHEQTTMKLDEKAELSGSSLALSSKTNQKGKRKGNYPCQNGHDPTQPHKQSQCWFDNPKTMPKRFRTTDSSSANANMAETNPSGADHHHSTSSHNEEDEDNAMPSFTYCSTTLMSSEKKLHAVLDSGASSHMFNSLEYFTNSAPTHVYILTGDGKSREQLTATRKGTVKFQMSTGKIIMLDDALYIPNLTCNLILFSQLID
jgi:hypothetical protein